jgi:predicted transcriptional regulator of viral defense system
MALHYTTTSSALPAGRQRLTQLVRAGGDVISLDDAVAVLGLDRNRAAKTLARWVGQGWLRRVGPGRYVAATLDTLESGLVLNDPWVLAPALFAPGYIGGRTAAEHWDLTEQMFNDIVVMTTQTVREKSQKRHGATFTLKHIAATRLFGTKPVWRGQTRVDVSDVHRTIIDMLDDPALGGGVQHVSDCLSAYLKRADRDDGMLLAYADRLGNGAVFKRLGFLVETDPNGTALIASCRQRLTKGNAKLDPALPSSRLVSRWRLFVPAQWAERGPR